MLGLVYHWILSSSVALYGSLLLGGGGIAASLLRQALPGVAVLKWAGAFFVAASIYLAGYQSADDRAQHERALAAEREKTQTTALERDAALRDLGAQKVAAKEARAQRDALAQTRSELQQKVADYEEIERTVPKPKADCNCGSDLITDRDIQWRRGLRPSK
jgi:hypothetical protein